MKLIAIGFYREMDPEEEGLPSIREAVSQSPQQEEDKIIAYLRNGICIGARGCFESDVLDPSCRLPLFGHSYTDGTYLWRLDLAHYVEKYHLRLPLDFIEHMRSLNWQPPKKEQVDVESLEA